MEKTLVLDFISDKDNWGITTSEEVRGVLDDGKKINYWVHDLFECPEDAILGRDLFSGWDYIETLELGMELAKRGYTSIEVNEISENDL